MLTFGAARAEVGTGQGGRRRGRRQWVAAVECDGVAEEEEGVGLGGGGGGVEWRLSEGGRRVVGSQRKALGEQHVHLDFA